MNRANTEVNTETRDERIARNEIYGQVISAEEDVKNGATPVPAREVFASLNEKYEYLR